MSGLDEIDQTLTFRADPTPCVVLDTAMVVRAANPAYLRATGRTREELLGEPLFGSFPANPELPEAGRVRESVERALRQRTRDQLSLVRYDLTDSAGSSEYRPRYWSVVTTPLWVESRVVGVLHQAHDLTSLSEELRGALDLLHEVLATDGIGEEARARLAQSAATLATEARFLGALREEVQQLRQALTSRATIDQAKGIIIGERRCSPDEAFKVLATMSSHTNVKVHDVAEALVREAVRPPDAQGDASPGRDGTATPL